MMDVSHLTNAEGHEQVAVKATKIAIGGKVIGGEKLLANGTELTLGDPTAAAKFAVIKAKAIADGQYAGKGLKFGEGGRAKMFYDQLRIDGKTEQQANDIVKINFFNKANAGAK